MCKGWLTRLSRGIGKNEVLVYSEPEHVPLMGTGRLRAAETLAYTSPRIKRLVDELGIKLMSYAEFGGR